MLTAVGDFFKSTFGESLKKPLQPAGLFAAAIFVLLNATFVYPVFIGHEESVAIIVRDAGSIWQATLAAVIVLVLAYILISMSGTILKVMTGELWSESPIVAATLRRQAQEEISNLTTIIASSTDSAERARARERLTSDLPEDVEQAMPTALGNTLAATAGYLRRRYGIELAAMWGHMEAILARDEALATRMNDEKSTLDFLTNLSFVLVVFAFQDALVGLVLRDSQPLVPVVALFLAWAVYRAAVDKARTWTAEIRLAFDLHREKLRESLSLPPFRSDVEERAAWQAMSRALQRGIALPRLQAEQPAFSSSPNAVVTLVRQELNSRVPHAAQESTIERYVEREYLFFVTRDPNVRAGATSLPMYVIVTDSRVRSVSISPADIAASTDGGTPWQPELMAGEDADSPLSLLWRGDLPPAGASRMLRYVVRLHRMRIVAPASLRAVGLTSNVDPLLGLIDCTCSVHLVPSQPGDLAETGAIEVQDDRILGPHIQQIVVYLPTARPTLEIALPDPKGPWVLRIVPGSPIGGRTTLRYAVLPWHDVRDGPARLREVSLVEILKNLQIQYDDSDKSITLASHLQSLNAARQEVFQDFAHFDYIGPEFRPDELAAASILQLEQTLLEGEVTARMYNRLGCAWAWLRNWDNAESNVEFAASFDPPDAVAASNLGLIRRAREIDAD